jgi:uncharacterized peroxidase-related enzyme
VTHPVHSVETAPPAARETLARAAKAFGFVPNLYGVMAAAPPLLEAYQALGSLFEKTSLTTTERQIVMLATSYENGCEYCVAAHSAIAGMQQVPAAVVEALRTGQAIADPKLEALRRFTAAVAATRARPSEADTAAFVAAGYTPAQILEVILGVGMKTLSNYTNHVAETPLDAAFAPAAWSASA